MLTGFVRKACAAVVVGATAAVATPATAQDAFLSLVAVGTSAGWYFEADLDGAAGTIPDATITPPGGSPLALSCTTEDEDDVCFRSSPPSDGDGFASLAALLVNFPAGEYLLAVDGGARSASVAFAPVAPDGSIHVTSPTSGALGVSATPTIHYTHDCDTCGFLFFEVDGFDATAGISLVTERIGVPPLPSPDSVPYTEFRSPGPPTPAALPEGSYRLTVRAGRGTLELESFEDGGGLEYGSGAEHRSSTLFSVPEPAGGSAVAASLAAIATVVARRASTGSRVQRERNLSGAAVRAHPHEVVVRSLE